MGGDVASTSPQVCENIALQKWLTSSSLHQTMASFNHSWLSSPLTETPAFFFSPSQHPKSLKLSLFRTRSNSSSPDRSSEVELDVDPVKLALKKAEAYKKSKSEQKKPEKNAGDEELPLSVKAAMQKANDYKKRKGLGTDAVAKAKPSNTDQSFVRLANKVVEDNDVKKKELKVSSIDFMGLGFADKKSTRGLPAGLVPVVDYLPEGDLPEVEFIVGDKTRFAEKVKEVEQEGDGNSDVYKPKVSTWGVFPRPSNISKTFGGGRTLRPGDSVETAEERIVREEKTKKLLIAYKESLGLNIDPKLKLECEKAIDEGNSLMDSGKLKEALPYYEKVMEKIVFKSELHGLAALQWSICQDSLRKTDKARRMYEKLISHPNPGVSKKARQFMFSFQAMEMLKVKGSSFAEGNTGYQDYFEAFVEDKTNYKAQEEKEGEEMGINETLLYVILLASPILMVFIVAAQRGYTH
ncbi:cytochrome C oxidase subunit [Arabidopsis thaliana]|nr:cytochrome C oxidase subunit [Arabidopsis thaliana]AEC09583.1 cytochrome C oxidase subunit [Arabidopsis thaliana]|eukprot:NP_181412.2 cytochrome C oxidase subunit [Arabidopsis thaliana]